MRITLLTCTVVATAFMMAHSLEAENQTPEGINEAQLSDSDDVLGLIWHETEFGNEWTGKWVRRGDSNVFDATIYKKLTNETKTFVATMTVDGYVVKVTSSNSSDGRNCTYEGLISEDGTFVNGTYTLSGNERYVWQAAITPSIQLTIEKGEYFLVREKSIVHDSGVTGLPPGTKVVLVEDRGERLFVRAGENELEIDKGEVSDDVAAVQEMVNADYLRQLKYQTQVVEAQQAVATAKREAERRAEEERSKLVAVTAQAHSGRTWENPLDRGAYGHTRVRPQRVASSWNGPAPKPVESKEEQELYHWRRAREFTLRAERQRLLSDDAGPAGRISNDTWKKLRENSQEFEAIRTDR